MISTAGICFHLYLFTHVSGLSLNSALFVCWAYRAVFAIPYIHVNIFQVTFLCTVVLCIFTEVHNILNLNFTYVKCIYITVENHWNLLEIVKLGIAIFGCIANCEPDILWVGYENFFYINILKLILAHRTTYVFCQTSSSANLPDVYRGSQPLTKPDTGLRFWSLTDKLSC